MFRCITLNLPKCATILIAGLALAGCEVAITPGVGTTINSTSPLFSSVVPETQTISAARPNTAQATPNAQTPTNAAQPAASPGLTTPNSGGTVANGGRRTLTTIGGALPIGISRADVNRFKTVVTQAGCNINTSALAGSVESQTGLDEEEIDRIVFYLARLGEINRGLRSYHLISGQCGNA